METVELKNELEKILVRLLPLFEVSTREFSKFKRFSISRKFVYPLKGRNIPGYNFDENYFYFPNGNLVKPERYNPFKESTLIHEISHYIHNMINPNNRIWLNVLKNTGKYSSGVMALRERVADYPCFVLDIVPDDKFLLRDSDLVYTKFGPDFLPRLARMDLEEVRSLGVI